MDDWKMLTLETAECRDCHSTNLKSIEDRFPVREFDEEDHHMRFSPRECEDCHEKFDVITSNGVVIGWSGESVEFIDTPPVYMTAKEAWDKGIRHGMRNPYHE